MEQSKADGVEIAALELSKDGETKYFDQPWEGNTKYESKNDFENLPSGYTNKNITAQYHSHPNELGISNGDTWVSKRNNLPIMP